MITFTKDIEVVPHNNPVAIANSGFPYNSLSNPRRFEELMYLVYKSEIESSAFAGFDDIALMSGVRDDGQDCALFKAGQLHGVIQCKKYQDRYNKAEFGEEIVKYALYNILNPTLIHERTDFSY